VVQCLGDRNPFVSDPEGEVGVESDCEGDSSEGTNWSLGVEGEEASSRAVLTVGSFSAYVDSRPSIPSLA
jgi:hypothetical protein